MTVKVLKYTRYVPPTAATFGTVLGTNAENPTLADTTDRGMKFAFGSSPGVGDNIRCGLKAKPTSTAYDIIARIQATPIGFNNYTYGLAISDGTKIILFGLADGQQTTVNMRFANQWWNSSTSYNSDKLNTANFQYDQCEWYRIGVVGGVPTDYYVSHDGSHWVKLLSQAATGFLTYTHIGVGIYVNRGGSLLPVASTPQAFLNILYWSDADIVPSV